MKRKIDFLQGEYWYGGAVNDGYIFPLSDKSNYQIDLVFNETYNQVNPLYISSKGRYIWLEKAGQISFSEGEITIQAEEIELDSSSTTLKEAYLKARDKHFPPQGEMLPKQVFNPQCCSWMELFYDQEQESILQYAREFAAVSKQRGIIIIDEGWQMDYGNWEFNLRRFPDPKQFVDELHKLGFLVLLWTCPYISPDSGEFRELEAKNLLLTDDKGELIIAHWWNGYSALLDLSKPEAQDWINAKFQYLQKTYGIDGFKLDGGDGQFLPKWYTEANMQTYYWADSIKTEIKELRACYKLAGRPIIQRLADKAHIWNVQRIKDEKLPTGGFLRYGFSAIIPNMLTAGITGYTYSCPDMVGGGLWLDFDKSKTDKELLIRWLQASILMPLMQFSSALWKVEEMGLNKITEEMLALREKFLPYICELAEKSSTTAEPIVRYMEYDFPNQGMEEVVSQFMLGDKYLIAPVLEKGVTTKKIYLPNGIWKDYYTGRKYNGGEEIAIPVEITSLPIFERI